MSHLANDQLLDTIRETIEWANELAEEWTGTTTGKIIDFEVTQLERAVNESDLELAQKLVYELALTCTKVDEQEYGR